MEIEARISQILFDQADAIALVLENTAGDQVVSIYVGYYEAAAIAREMEQVVPLRPQTHDLMKGLLFCLGAAVRSIVITGLKDGTFYALVRIDNNGKTIWLDSRPSDAIALALRMHCPIYVQENLLSPVLDQSEGTRFPAQ